MKNNFFQNKKKKYIQRSNTLKKYVSESLIPYCMNNYNKRLILKLKKGYLISKILKEKYFWKSKFITTNNTLDPREDTEKLLEVFLNKFNEYDPINNNNKMEKKTLIDICSGTGNIGISLLNEITYFRCTFLDVSHKALQICKKNIRNHKLWHKSHIIKNCFFKFLNDNLNNINNKNKIKKKYDFAVSNPPYLLDSEIKLNPILNQDPYISLYGGCDGLDFYKGLAVFCKKFVKYFTCVEIDHCRCQEIFLIFNQYNFKELIIYKDNYNLNRILLCVNE